MVLCQVCRDVRLLIGTGTADKDMYTSVKPTLNRSLSDNDYGNQKKVTEEVEELSEGHISPRSIAKATRNSLREDASQVLTVHPKCMLVRRLPMCAVKNTYNGCMREYLVLLYKMFIKFQYGGNITTPKTS